MSTDVEKNDIERLAEWPFPHRYAICVTDRSLGRHVRGGDNTLRGAMTRAREINAREETADARVYTRLKTGWMRR